jgi:hypothetical protein
MLLELQRRYRPVTSAEMGCQRKLRWSDGGIFLLADRPTGAINRFVSVRGPNIADMRRGGGGLWGFQ